MTLPQIYDRFSGFFKKHYVVIIIIAFIMTLIPMICVSIYDRPSADDFSYSRTVHFALLHSGLKALPGVVLAKVQSTYMIWQGTYSAIFLMALQPGVFLPQAYFITPLIMLGMLIFGTFYLMHTLVCRWLQAGFKFFFLLAVAMQLLSIELLPSIVQGFYWYNGAVFYTFFYSLMLIYLGLFIRLALVQVRGRKIVLLVPLLVLAFIIGGGNYVTGFLTLLLGLMLIILYIYKKNKNARLLILPELILLISFLINAVAPGNSVRQAELHKMGPFLAILQSLNQARYDIRAWSTIYVFFIILLLLPLFYIITGRVKLSFKYPLLVLVVTLLLYSAQYAPAFYSMSYAGPPRLLDIVYYSYIWLLYTNLFYVTGWFRKHSQPVKNLLFKKFKYSFSPMKLKRLIKTIYVVAAVVVLYHCLTVGGIYKMTSVVCFKDLSSGTAKAYAKEIDERTVIYDDKNITNVVVIPLTVKPKSIYLTDLSNLKSNSYWINEDVAKYYKKISVNLSIKLNSGE